MDQKIIFKYGTQAEYDSLGQGRSEDTLFFITDSQRLYRGDLLMAAGKDVTSVASGLMSPEQYAQLESLIGRVAAIEAELPKKTDEVVESAAGRSLVWNETSGGGAKFENVDGSEAFIGVNSEGKNGLMAQIYADVKEDGAWVGSRINVYHNGIYYVSKANQKAGFAKNAAEMEIATKKDIADLGRVLRFRGIFDSLDEVENPQHGDVAIVGNKEYIYVVKDGVGAWCEFGDVSAYATKEELAAAKVELGALISAEETRAKAAEAELAESIDEAATAAQAYMDSKIADEEAARIAEDAKKVDKELSGAAGKSLIFNESDGGGAKLEGNNKVIAYVGTHDNIGGEIGTQIYVDKANGTESTIIDVTQNGAYYTKGTILPGAQRDIADNEIATKKDVADGAPKWEPIA